MADVTHAKGGHMSGELVAKIKGVNEVCFVNSAWRSDGSQAAGTEDCL